MRRLRRDIRGQAFVELALVIFLFYLFITGVMQLVMLGSAQIKCQQAARRAAVLLNIYNNAPHINDNWQQVQAILPGCTQEKLSGNRDEGYAYKLAYKVPAIGFFRLTHPDGFPISARGAVIAYNPHPEVSKHLNHLVDWVSSKLSGH